MTLPEAWTGVKGAEELHDWFGFWPSFHDAEIVSLHLNRMGPSHLVIHTWEINHDVDERGYSKLDKHVVVEFGLGDISELELVQFSRQNVISGLHLERLGESYKLQMDPCYGLGGAIVCRTISLTITPGKPSDRRS